jgi:putative transposase
LTGSSGNGIQRKKAERMDQVWTFDFCHDRTADNGPLKIFSVIDEFTRRCLAILVRRRMTGGDVVKVLKGLIEAHGGAPEHIRCDNGPEFACAAVRSWLARARVAALYIAPGSPWENGYAESYHARLRDELLDREEFGTLSQAQGMLEIWREEYNNERPHGSLGYQTPAAFADACRGAGPGFASLRPGQHRGEETSVDSVAL